MKTLSTEEIECLLGVRASDQHPLDILGYGYTSDGVHRFREERPDFLPQIVGHVQRVLQMVGAFPPDMYTRDAGRRTFIRHDGDSFTVSSMKEIGLSRYERITSQRMSEAAAIHEVIRLVANPDYVCVADTMT
jgi:hypothetical protein